MLFSDRYRGVFRYLTAVEIRWSQTLEYVSEVSVRLLGKDFRDTSLLDTASMLEAFVLRSDLDICLFSRSDIQLHFFTCHLPKLLCTAHWAGAPCWEPKPGRSLRSLQPGYAAP